MTKTKNLILLIQKLFTRTEIHFSEPKSNEFEPIFIIGAPRTGSTLLFQLMIIKFNMFYISNLMALFPVFMNFIARIFKNKIKNYSEVKSSNYGFVSGLHSPNEAGKINRFWFSKKRSLKEKKSIGYTYTKLSNTVNSPVLIKALVNAVQIKEVLDIFPKARFIFIKRNIFDNAKSILEGRKRNNGEMKSWFSIKPKGFHEGILNLSPYEQVVWQITEMNRYIEEQLMGVTALTVDYELLCSNTVEVMEQIQQEFDLTPKLEVEKGIENSIKLRDKNKQVLSEMELNELNKAIQNYNLKKGQK